MATASGDRAADREIVIVDERNRVVGAATRKQVHREALPHRAIHCFVYDSEGRIYLSRRDDVVCRGKLDIALTEHVWPGEDYDATVRRALPSRLGIAGSDPRPLSEIFRDVDEHEGGDDYEEDTIVDDRFMQIFAAAHDGPVDFDRRVYEGGEWYRLEDLEAEIAAHPDRFTPHFVKDWERARPALERLRAEPAAGSAS